MGREAELLDRTTVRSDIFGGKPIIRGMRFAVEHMLELLAAGDSTETILNEYPFLEAEDVQACLLYAHRSLAGVAIHDRNPVRGLREVLAGRMRCIADFREGTCGRRP